MVNPIGKPIHSVVGALSGETFFPFQSTNDLTQSQTVGKQLLWITIGLSAAIANRPKRGLSSSCERISETYQLQVLTLLLHQRARLASLWALTAFNCV